MRVEGSKKEMEEGGGEVGEGVGGRGVKEL